MKAEKKTPYSVHKQLLAGSHLLNMFRLLKENGFVVHIKYWPRFLYTCLICSFATLAALIEQVFYYKKIKNTEVKHPPVFIIGHWRTGTTFLHNLMSQDEKFGILDNEHAILPNLMFLFRPLVKLFFKLNMPKYRPMDKVELKVDGPQEDELALCNISPRSAYHAWSFPKKMRYYFEKWCLMQGLTDAEREALRKDYAYLLQKITLANKGKRLLLKNPVNTGRIELLLEMFPDAKFIYLSRDRREVELSSYRLHIKTLEVTTLQHYNEDKFKAYIPELYDALLEKYASGKKLIPQGNLIEIKYEDFIRNPVGIVGEIYKKMDLGPVQDVLPTFKTFLETQARYKPAVYNKK